MSGLHTTSVALSTSSASLPPAARCSAKRSAWLRPVSLSGWSTAESIATTSLFACAAFHTDSPWRTRYTVLRGGAASGTTRARVMSGCGSGFVSPAAESRRTESR